uniref:GTP-binding protein Rheb n=1 Tax=Oryctolagus cuniculus TaxID=9986 RepID=A0A5F9CAT2_RABIT
MSQSKSRKIAILGYQSMGKSSLTIQFVEGQFVDSYDPTIENTFTKLITVNGQEYHLQLVDTAGQEEYSIFPQTYSIDINGYIIVYSVTSIKSFEVIKVIPGKLLDMVEKVQIPIMLVGNKKDLHMERVISYEEGKALAESWNTAFLESSAKENQTAVDVFRRIILEAEKIDGAAHKKVFVLGDVMPLQTRGHWESILPEEANCPSSFKINSASFSSVNLREIIWVRACPPFRLC